MPQKLPRKAAAAMVRWKWPTTHMVSCKYKSVAMVPRYSPVKPPKPKTKTVPSAKSIGLVNRLEPFQIVWSQLRKRISAGTEMISVRTMKPFPSSGFIPVTNMWWPYTTAITILSAVVYGHHMFVTGMNPLLGKGFMVLTLIISVPAEILFLNWLHTIWKGSNRLTSPMLFALGTVFVFGLGGLTGLYLGTIATDLYLHDTMWVVGHFHLTMAAAAFLGSFCGIYFWFPKMFGRHMHEGLAKAHFWTSAIFITLVFCGQLLAGFAGQQRRLYDPYQYTFLKHLLPLNQWTSYFAFALGFSQFLFVINFIRSLAVGEKAERNPWQIGTLEWTLCPSPPEHYNYSPIPTVYRGPHEFNNPELNKALGRDWVGQAEQLPPAMAPASAKPAAGGAKS